MAAAIDIFNPQTSVVAEGLEGKVIMLYGGNNLGKTYVASRLSKPFFIACESGLNAISGVKYNRVNSWADFMKLIRQFTGKKTVDQARSMYDTIVIDEVYAASVFCQDYVISTYGEGALSLGDGQGKVNLYQQYEKEFFKAINQLLSCNYTVVFIGHAVEKDGYISPKGDKRCLNPIVDNCDFVVYLQSNGVDENGHVIHSSAYLAQTDKFFARSRFEYCPTYIEDFTAENLEATIKKAIQLEKEHGATVVTYEEQKEQNTTNAMTYEETMDALAMVGQKFVESGNQELLTEIVESVLGKGKKVSQCTKKQLDAMTIILDDLDEKAQELGI